MLIFAAAVLIIYESVRKLLGESEPLSEDLLLLGIGIMAVSAVLNWYVSTRLMDCAKRTESIALESDAWHLRTDVYTSLGILAGLVVIRLTGFAWLDPIFAIAVAAIIIKAAYDLTRRSFSDLLDQQLPDNEVQRIRQIICDHRTAYADLHGLRTRRGGPERFVEFHVLLAKDLSVQQAHDLADHLEDDIKVEYPRTHVTIHMEPCEEECAACEACCNLPRTFCPVQKTEK
jgi:cation diffusion facilitator family transporter